MAASDVDVSAGRGANPATWQGISCEPGGKVAGPGVTDVDVRLVSQAQYAAERGVTRQAINRFVRDWGLPTYGSRHMVDAEALDRVYYPRLDAGQPQLRIRDAYGRRWPPR